MVYRDLSDSAHRARANPLPARRSRALTCNVLIAGAALSSVALVSAGATLFGGNGLGSPAPYADSRNALKVALIDPAAPTVVKRDPRIALNPMALEIPDAAPAVVAARTEREAAPLAGEPARIDVADAVPLPAPRLQQAAIVAAALAAIPLPRERHSAVQALAALDTKSRSAAEPDTTGSLGETPHALGYAAFEPSPIEQKPVMAAAKPVAPAAVAARANDFIGPVLPANRKLAAQKPARPLTPREKLYGTGPVRVASLGTTDGLGGPGFDPKSGLPVAPYDKQTAVYIISDRKVYMPDGSVLEAHSGLGDKMDDPRFVQLRMRGATPPHVYDLMLRESPFHGVEAIRMTPMGGEEAIFGRDGILAHSYMLGHSGQSNGCVSFKDYETFLDAFKDGKVNRLAVLARLD